MKQRTITAAILLAVLVPLVIIGSYPFYVLMGLGIGYAMFELMKATEGKKEKNEKKTRCLSWPIGLIIIAPLITIVGAFYPYIINAINGLGFTNKLELILPIIPFFILSFTLFTSSILTERVNVIDVFMVLAMSVFLMIGGQSLLLIRDLGLSFIIFVLLTCILTDTGAYFAGMICSKKFKTHKLNERISPKKTIEGSIGGMLIGTLVPFGLTFIPILNLESSAFIGISLDWYVILLLAFSMSVVAQIGDLTFSAIKRHYEIKDYSNLFPGHGGVLDRLDSILFNMIFFAVMFLLIVTGAIF